MGALLARPGDLGPAQPPRHRPAAARPSVRGQRRLHPSRRRRLRRGLSQDHARLPRPQPRRLSLIKSLADGLRKLDADTLAKLQTFAELQPLLADKGVALATDTKDYMIPVAVEANKLQDRLSLFGGIAALAAGDRRRRLRRQPGPAARARPQQRRAADAVGRCSAPRPSPSSPPSASCCRCSSRRISFFERVRRSSFFFGTVWDPRFAAAGAGATEGQFGLIPLLAGTLYIALLALAGRRPGRAVRRHLPVRIRLTAASARWSSRCSRSSPASRPSSTASSRW